MKAVWLLGRTSCLCTAALSSHVAHALQPALRQPSWEAHLAPREPGSTAGAGNQTLRSRMSRAWPGWNQATKQPLCIPTRRVEARVRFIASDRHGGDIAPFDGSRCCARSTAASPSPSASHDSRRCYVRHQRKRRRGGPARGILREHGAAALEAWRVAPGPTPTAASTSGNTYSSLPCLTLKLSGFRIQRMSPLKIPRQYSECKKQAES
jgi:hypothetical protein